MRIRYKLIENERIGDAPFCGALVSAINCNINCQKCFNQNIKNMDTLYSKPNDIVEKIKENPFNKGIIFGGLEWTLQKEELYIMSKKAKKEGLKTMLYTGRSMEYLIRNKYPIQYLDFIKCGPYLENNRTINHIEYGITLASSNQRIYKRGVDY